MTTDPSSASDEALGLLRSPQAGRDIEVLNRGIELLRSAVAASPGGVPEYAQFMSNLGNALQLRFDRLGNLSDLDEAIVIGRQAVASARADDSNMGAYLSSLGNALTHRFERLDCLADLHESVDLGRQAVAATSADQAGHTMYLTNLAITLRARFGRLGDLSDLHEVIEIARSAVAVTPASEPDGARYRSNLGNALQNRFESTGDLADLSEAIEMGREAVLATPAGRPSRAAYLTNLGLALRLRSERGGGMVDVNEAIEVCQQAVAATPHDHPNLAGRLSNLSAALRARFLQAGRLMDLDEAVEVCRLAVANTSPDDAALTLYLVNLGLALQYRFERVADMVDLDEAIDVNQRAIRATPEGQLYRPMYLSNLCSAFQARFSRNSDGVDLDSAIATGQQAVAVTPEDHPSLAWRLSNLASALQSRYLRDGDQTDFDDAVDASRRAVDITPFDHPNRAIVLSTYASILLGRFQRTHEPDLQQRAIAAFCEGAGVDSASPRLRVSCGIQQAQLAADTGALAQAAIAWDGVYQQLPLLTDRQLIRADRQHHLNLIEGASSEAASVALRRGDVAQAWQFLEQGRGVLLGQALETRTDVAALRVVNRDLAAAVDAIRHTLNDDAPTVADATVDPATISRGWMETISRRRRAVQDWGRVVDDIRHLPGFERFALPPTLEELRRTASGGAIVAVNVSRSGSDALVLTSDKAECVPLPLLNRAEAAQRANDLASSTWGRAGSRSLFDTMAWLWDAVAQPVLARLGHTAPWRPGLPWPRLWWVLTGPLSLLPIHAAGRHDGPAAATVLDRVVSSYAPTVRALHHARRRSRRGRPTGLTVGLRQAAGQAPLPGAAAEAELASDFLGGTVLRNGAATRAAIMTALPSVTWTHFACHAVTAADPAESHLVVADGVVSVRDLTDLNLDAAYLAYLSACTTGVGGAHLMDESIHVASAFQICGFRHVIATIWPVPDRVALGYARQIYHRLAGSPEIATRVHMATREIRHRYSHHPFAWASHIHFGP